MPTTALAATILAGMPKTRAATVQAVANPAIADRPALTRPEASNPSNTKTGKAAAAVELGQLPSGS
jgi:hypothetical protein